MSGAKQGTQRPAMDTTEEAAAFKQHYWEDVLWTDKTTLALVWKNTQLDGVV